MNEGTPGLSEAKGRTSVCPAKGRCSPGRARHPLRDGVAVGTPQCGLGAEQGAGTRARWKPGSKVPAGCTASRTGPASHCIPLSLARQHPQLALRGPRLPLPRAAHWGPGRPWSHSRLRPGLHPCREQSQGLWGFPGGNGKAEDVLQIRRAGAAGSTAAGFGGLWETWGGCGALGWLWGSGRLRELSPPPSLGWALRAQPVWGWWEHSGTGSPWCCQALAVAPGLTVTAGPVVLPDNAKEPCWAGGSWDGAHGTGQAPHALT